MVPSISDEAAAAYAASRHGSSPVVKVEVAPAREVRPFWAMSASNESPISHQQGSSIVGRSYDGLGERYRAQSGRTQ